MKDTPFCRKMADFKYWGELKKAIADLKARKYREGVKDAKWDNCDEAIRRLAKKPVSGTWTDPQSGKKRRHSGYGRLLAIARCVIWAESADNVSERNETEDYGLMQTNKWHWKQHCIDITEDRCYWETGWEDPVKNMMCGMWELCHYAAQWDWNWVRLGNERFLAIRNQDYRDCISCYVGLDTPDYGVGIEYDA